MTKDEKNDYLKKLELTLKCINEIYKQYQDKEYSLSMESRMSFDIFDKIIHIFEYDGLPTILKDQEYEKIKTIELYRGVKRFTSMVDFLTNKSYHSGMGYINGIFASVYYSTATSYTEGFLEHEENEDKILKFKISLNSGITYERLFDIRGLFAYPDFYKGKTITNKAVKEKLEILQEFTNNLPKIEKERFIKCLSQDESKLAIILGYNYILDDSKENENNFIILNRSIVKTSESELNRFESRAKADEYYSK